MLTWRLWQHVLLIGGGALVAVFGYALTDAGSTAAGYAVLGVGGTLMQVGIVAAGVRLGTAPEPPPVDTE